MGHGAWCRVLLKVVGVHTVCRCAVVWRCRGAEEVQGAGCRVQGADVQMMCSGQMLGAVHMTCLEVLEQHMTIRKQEAGIVLVILTCCSHAALSTPSSCTLMIARMIIIHDIHSYPLQLSLSPLLLLLPLCSSVPHPAMIGASN